MLAASHGAWKAINRGDAAAAEPENNMALPSYQYCASQRPSTVRSPVFRDCAELLDGKLGSLPLLGVDEAVIDVVVDEGPLGACDGILNRLELLRDINAGTLIFDHYDDAAKVAGRAVQPLDDRRVTGVSVMGHVAL